MSKQVNFHWYAKAKKELEERPNLITYAIARQTLDLSFPHIPKDRGIMRQTSTSAGVRGTDGNYYIGSYTKYALKVWKMPDNTNWSEPNTFGRWYEKIWKRLGDNITKNIVERYKLK